MSPMDSAAISPIPVTGELISPAEAINAAHRAAQASVGEAVTQAIRAGQLLIEQKARLPHGQFGAWVNQHCMFSERTARLYMRCAAWANENGNVLPNCSLRALAGEIGDRRQSQKVRGTSDDDPTDIKQPPELHCRALLRQMRERFDSLPEADRELFVMSLEEAFLDADRMFEKARKRRDSKAHTLNNQRRQLQ